MVRQVADWLARGWHRAALVAALLVVVPLTSSLSAAVVAFVTLDRGVRAGLLVAGGAALVAAALIIAQGGEWPRALGALAMLFLPALGLAVLLRATGSLTLCLQFSVLAGVALVLGMFALMDDPLGYWELILDQWATLLEQAGAGPDMRRYFAAATPFMPGIFASSLVLLMLTSLFVGRWLQAARTDGLELGTEFRELRLGYLIAGAATLLVALALLGGGAWVENLMPVLLAGCLLQGLAVLHAVKARLRISTAWLVMTYVLLCIPQTALPATLALISVGYADNWIDVRARLRKPAD